MRFCLLVVFLALGSGCNQTEGVASIECVEDSSWSGCPPLPRVFKADFFSLQDLDDTLELRLQQGGKGADEAAGFQIQVFGTYGDLWHAPEIGCLNQDVELETPDPELFERSSFLGCQRQGVCQSTAGCPLVRLTAHFPGECGVDRVPMIAGGRGANEGSVVNFVSLGTRSGETVSGAFNVQIRDARTGEPVGRCKTVGAGFSFVVKEGQPYVRFTE